MNLDPFYQKNLYGLNSYFDELVLLFKKTKLPNKILLNGKRGIGKFTLANHFINYCLSLDEDFSYDVKNYEINDQNHSYKLIINKSSPNLFLIDLNDEKKNIEINQIRNLIDFCNKSNFNSKPRFILINNLEKMNLNSSNALLKILEEPNEGIFFILINSSSKILPTIKSRCLSFNISLSSNEIFEISSKIIGENINQILNEDFLNYYFSIGDLVNICEFAKMNNIDLSNITLNEFLKTIIKDKIYKKETLISDLIYNLIEIYYLRNIKTNITKEYENHIRLVNNTKKFNLDTESIFLKLQQNLINE